MSTSCIRAVFFDFMGTCLDWHTTVTQSLPSTISHATRSRLALQWRQLFFLEIESRFRQGLPVEDIDETHRRTLPRVLEQTEFHDCRQYFGQQEINQAVASWHTQSAWPEVRIAIESLRKELQLDVVVLANGTTRLQLDLARSSALTFDLLLSSELLGLYKPSPSCYQKALQLVGVQPEQAVMVAAHAYDLRAARECGLNVVYIQRSTDDLHEDHEALAREFEHCLSDMSRLPDLLRRLRSPAE